MIQGRFLLLLIASCLALGSGCGSDGGTAAPPPTDVIEDTAHAPDTPVPQDAPAGEDTGARETAETSDGGGSCAAGETACRGSVLVLCEEDGEREVFDCADEGWSCDDGRCVALGEESESAAEYRERLTALRLENAPQEMELDRFGGWKNAPESLGPPSPGPFFRVEKRGGSWWFITPDGYPMVSKGVTDVHWLGASFAPDQWHEHLVAKFGDEETWADDAQARAEAWAFNTIGPWSSQSMTARMSHAVIILDSAGHAPRYRAGDPLTDYWSEGFFDNAARVVRERALPFVDDERLIGYFLDNELVWVPLAWQTRKTMLQLYVEFPEDAPGRAVALDHVRNAAADIAEFNATWETSIVDWDELEGLTFEVFQPRTEAADAVTESFMLKAFRQYATVAIAAVREVDQNHLILGCRFSSYHSDALMRAAAEFFDVISIAYYSPEPPVDVIDAIYDELDMPFLIEEFSYKADDSGLMNILNYAPTVPTQKDRGLAYDRWVGEFMRRPYAIGYHWYKWFDNPPRDDYVLAGDNFGLMNSLDEPYLPFTTMAGEVNRRIEWWHYTGIR